MLLVEVLSCFMQANVSVAPTEIWPYFGVQMGSARPASCDYLVSNGKVRLQFQTPDETVMFDKPTNDKMAVTVSSFLQRDAMGTTAKGMNMSESQFTALARRVKLATRVQVYYNDVMLLDLAPTRVYESAPLDGGLSEKEKLYLIIGCSAGGGVLVIICAVCCAVQCCRAKEQAREREHELRLARIKEGRGLEPLPQASPRLDAELQLLEVQALELQKKIQRLSASPVARENVVVQGAVAGGEAGIKPWTALGDAQGQQWTEDQENYKWL